ncbi:MAG TPA: tetratricopeptide repeat protein [Pyrinomonadaceae bacterium]|nr:tetratricopeptide repeat protein [Pyrinomonadaceae bacterium]
MKRCPKCGREYDNTMMFCLDDGAELLYGAASGSRSEPPASAGGQFSDEPRTAILHSTAAPGEAPTRAQINATDQTAILHTGAEAEPRESLGGLSERQSLSANRAAEPQGALSSSLTKPLIAVALAVAVLVGGFFGFRYFSASGSGQINSIAVMPFENRNSDADTDYLSDGLAESVIFRLTQLPDLRVSPTSSVMRYKGKETDVAKIASELGVDAVMTGRLTKRGDNLNITVELVDARTNKSLWGEQYERKLSELLTTQREIVTEIVSKLQLKLSGESEQKLAKKYTDNNEAYQLYLQGRFHWNKRTRESFKQAVEFFNRAIEKDPKFALAYSGLAESYVLFPNYSVAPPLEAMPKAKAAALRAIELDDSLAQTHVALGIYYSLFAWNLPAGEKEFRRAIELDPNYATAHQQYGIECLSLMGRFDEAIAAGKRAEELDPFSLIIGADLGNVLTNARRFDEAIAQIKKVIALDENFWVAHWYLGRAYHANGQYREAVAEYRKAISLNENSFIKAMLISSLAKAGERGEAVKLLGELQEESVRRYVSSSAFAVAYAALGDMDNAFDYMEKEIDERSSRVPTLKVNSTWDDMRDDPRFDELVRKVEQAKMD